MSFLWGHWYHCFGLLVTSALSFKARIDLLLVCFLTCALFRFTSGATATYLLMASMAAELFWPTYLWPSDVSQSISGTLAQTRDLACHSGSAGRGLTFFYRLLFSVVADLGCDFTDGDLDKCGYTSKEATGGLMWQAVPASLVTAMLEYDYGGKFRKVTWYLNRLN